MDDYGRFSADDTLLSWYPHPALTAHNGRVTRMNRAAEAALADWRGRELEALLPDCAEALERLKTGTDAEPMEPLAQWPVGHDARYRVAGLRHEERLYILFAPLEGADELPSFMLNVDKEIRTQLPLLFSSVRTLRKLCLGHAVLEPAERQKAAEEIAKLQHLAFRFLRMASNIRDTARFLRGEEIIEPRRIDFAQLCRLVCAEVNRITETDAVSLTLPEEPLILEGDGQMLERVLYNLLANALLHRAGEEPIRCELDADGGRARLCVSGGESIPGSVMGTLFHGYAQQRELSAPSGMGLSLGLPLSRFIIERHQGVLLPASGPEGTSVVLSLPLSAGEPEDEDDSSFASDISYTGGFPAGLVELSSHPLGMGAYRGDANRDAGLSPAREEPV